MSEVFLEYVLCGACGINMQNSAEFVLRFGIPTFSAKNAKLL